MRKFIEPSIDVISIDVEDVILASGEGYETLTDQVNNKTATNIGQTNGVNVFTTQG